MKLAFVCAVLLSLTSLACTQNIQIQALPPTVTLQENDLVILCSVTNPSQMSVIFSIQLWRNITSGFEEVVSAITGKTPIVQWVDQALKGRATATGSLEITSSPELRLTVDKNSVQCPSDFSMYMCKLTGYSTASVEVETNPIKVSYNVKPTVIEMPRVRILNQNFDTPSRQFPVGTAIQLTCQGQVGSDKSKTIRWCARKSGDFSFTGLAQTPIHSEASPSGCQYTRSSTITYNLTSADTFTRFLCESGDSGLCETGTAIQYVNITIETSTEGSGNTNLRTADDTSDAGIIAGGVIGGLAALILIILLVYFLVLRRKSDGESYRTKEDVPGYNGPANPEGPVYSVPVKDNPPHERQHRRKHPRDEEERRKYRGHENDGLDEDHTAKSEKEIDYQNHSYANRGMNDYGDDGDVAPRGQPAFGSAV